MEKKLLCSTLSCASRPTVPLKPQIVTHSPKFRAGDDHWAPNETASLSSSIDRTFGYNASDIVESGQFLSDRAALVHTPGTPRPHAAQNLLQLHVYFRCALVQATTAVTQTSGPSESGERNSFVIALVSLALSCLSRDTPSAG